MPINLMPTYALERYGIYLSPQTTTIEHSNSSDKKRFHPGITYFENNKP